MQLINSYFSLMFYFYNLRKRQNTKSYLNFSTNIGMEHWVKIGEQFDFAIHKLTLPLVSSTSMLVEAAKKDIFQNIKT